MRSAAAPSVRAATSCEVPPPVRRVFFLRVHIYVTVLTFVHFRPFPFFSWFVSLRKREKDRSRGTMAVSGWNSIELPHLQFLVSVMGVLSAQEINGLAYGRDVSLLSTTTAYTPDRPLIAHRCCWG